MIRGPILHLFACATALLLPQAAPAQTQPAGAGAAQAAADPAQPPPHTSGWPDLRIGNSEAQRDGSYALGPEYSRGQSARAMLAERRRLDAALAGLQPQRAGQVDAYVIAVALDSDPVFAREAREAGNVLTRRYNAQGRSITLAGPDGRSADLAKGTPSSLALALARVAEVMDPAEDVLVLYSTSHGAQVGLAFHEGDSGFGIISPARFSALLRELGIRRRVLMISACYSGVFVPALASPDTAIVTAASRDRSSFGCQAENDWTFFGDALINHAMRSNQPLADAARAAQSEISGWERSRGLEASFPQVSIGTGVAAWLAPLEAQIPAEETRPVGRPATG